MLNTTLKCFTSICSCNHPTLLEADIIIIPVLRDEDNKALEIKQLVKALMELQNEIAVTQDKIWKRAI